MRFKNCEGQVSRWLEVLSAYTLTIVHVHRAGSVHKMQIHCPIEHVTAMTVNTVIDIREYIF